MPEEPFGRPIKKSDADLYFKKFVAIKRRGTDILKGALPASDTEARRYYCGRSTRDAAFEDWAFVFDRNLLTELMNDITNLNADGIFIFNGAKDISTTPAAEIKEDDVDGRPSLMIFPYAHFEANADTDVEFTIFEDNGRQYPGTGGGTITTSLPGMLPTSFTKGQYHL